MTRKKVILVGPPFSGHLHPLLGIGVALQSVADVIVVSTPFGVNAARQAGLKAQPIMSEHEKSIWEIADPGVSVRSHPLKLWRQLQGNVRLLPEMKRQLNVLYKEHKPDLIIADFTVPVAGLAASQMGIPWWTTLPSPCVFETCDGPPAYFGGQTPAHTWFQHFKHATLRQLTRQFKRAMWMLCRHTFREIGLACVYRSDGSEAIYSPHQILALGIPEIEFPRSYPSHFKFVGPMLYTPPYQGPKPIFKHDCRSHILITIGTHLKHAKKSLLAKFRDIVTRHPEIMFHFSHGDVEGSTNNLVENIHELSFISYADNLPKYDLVVHHAGAGILYHCLIHGIPSVVYPLDYDQFDNAARLQTHKLALTIKHDCHLESAIQDGLQNRELLRNCKNICNVLKQHNALPYITNMVTDLV